MLIEVGEIYHIEHNNMLGRTVHKVEVKEIYEKKRFWWTDTYVIVSGPSYDGVHTLKEFKEMLVTRTIQSVEL